MKQMTAAEMGRKGGKAKTEAKVAAVTENLRLARLKRWPKKKTGGSK